MTELMCNVMQTICAYDLIDWLKMFTIINRTCCNSIRPKYTAKLIDWCFTARQHKTGQFVPIYQGGLLAQAFEDSQQ